MPGGHRGWPGRYRDRSARTASLQGRLRARSVPRRTAPACLPEPDSGIQDQRRRPLPGLASTCRHRRKRARYRRPGRSPVVACVGRWLSQDSTEVGTSKRAASPKFSRWVCTLTYRARHASPVPLGSRTVVVGREPSIPDPRPWTAPPAVRLTHPRPSMMAPRHLEANRDVVEAPPTAKAPELMALSHGGEGERAPRPELESITPNRSPPGQGARGCRDAPAGGPTRSTSRWAVSPCRPRRRDATGSPAVGGASGRRRSTRRPSRPA